MLCFSRIGLDAGSRGGAPIAEAAAPFLPVLFDLLDRARPQPALFAAQRLWRRASAARWRLILATAGAVALLVACPFPYRIDADCRIAPTVKQLARHGAFLVRDPDSSGARRRRDFHGGGGFADSRMVERSAPSGRGQLARRHFGPGSGRTGLVRRGDLAQPSGHQGTLQRGMIKFSVRGLAFRRDHGKNVALHGK